MRVLKSELKAVSAEFDGNANSVDALRKKNEVLNKQQKEQEKRVALLRGALENSAKQYGENSKQVQDWQIKLNNASAYLLKLNREVEDNKKYMKEAEQSTDKTAKSINEFGKQIEDAGQKTGIFGDVLKANLVSDAISDGVKKLARELGDAIEESIELASDLEEVQNVVDVTFGKGAENIDSWAESMGDAHGVSVLFSKQFAGTMGAMLKSMQVTDDQVLKMSKNLVQLAGDMASFYNIDIETAFTKIRSGISGETEPLKQLGVNLNVANLEAYALAEGIEKAYSQMTQAEQVTLRYNYLLKVTADAQGDFARNIDSLANQQRIADLQREEILTKLGDAVIPAVTRATMKLNEAMDGMGDDLGEVAEILAEGIVDAFVWMVDNSDKVIAGLKGIGAAILAKKAGDGVLYVVSAYKTLTTTTQVATTAQLAFNTASKANIYVALASAIIGAAYAVDSFITSTKNATRETVKMDEETKRLIESSERLTKSIKDRANAWEDEQRSIEANYGTAKILSDKLYELAEKEQKTNAEKQEMISLVEQLNRIIPDFNLAINEQTGLLTKQKDEIGEVIDSFKKLALTRAAEDTYTELLKSRIDAEIQLNNLVEERNRLEEELDYEGLGEKAARYLELRGKGYVWLNKEEKKFIKDNAGVFDSLEKASDKIEPYRRQIRELGKELDRLSKTTESVESFISESFMSSSTYLDGFTAKYQKYLDEQTQAEIGTLEDRQKKISKIYEQTSKELDKQLKAEERAFAKSQQKRVEEVQKAQDKELKEVEKVHKAKLDLLNEEYLEKIKTVDEDRYNELKKVQDEIDAIDNQQEAEDRALQLREEAEKKAELQSRIESAKTIEERMDAQKELQKHEQRVAKERLKEERTLQKDILKEQKDTINKSFDEKVKAIEAEQKKEQEKLADQLKDEKEAVSERYKLKLEALKEEQELEKDALRERQTEYKDYLREQKELTVANSKAIYEEDLAKFKMNQALKLEEVTSSEEQMKKVMLDYANKIMLYGDTSTGRAIMNADSLEEMLKYYNPTGMIKSSVPQSTSIDYSMIEVAMSKALKKLNLSVKIGTKEIGQIIDERIAYNLRR